MNPLTNSQVLGNDMYTAKLTIQGFSEEDSNKNYYLVVENEIGQTQYLIKLSVHDAPIGKYITT